MFVANYVVCRLWGLSQYCLPDHGCPAGGDDPAGAAAADGGRGVDTTRPVSVGEPLVVPVAAVPVQQHRRTLGRIYSA